MPSIPHVFFQTNYKNPEDYMLEMIRSQLDSTWEYKFFSDEDVISFFNSNPLEDFPDIVAKYNDIKSGAHRADLFRYYYLYLNGGFFMDSDAMLYGKLNDILGEYEFVSVESRNQETIFQGVLGASPKNVLIARALREAYNTPYVPILHTDYNAYFKTCKDMYNIIKTDDSGCLVKLYKEVEEPGWGYGATMNDSGDVIFKHYWSTKVIPK